MELKKKRICLLIGVALLLIVSMSVSSLCIAQALEAMPTDFVVTSRIVKNHSIGEDTQIYIDDPTGYLFYHYSLETDVLPKEVSYYLKGYLIEDVLMTEGCNVNCEYLHKVLWNVNTKRQRKYTMDDFNQNKNHSKYDYIKLANKLVGVKTEYIYHVAGVGDRVIIVQGGEPKNPVQE